MSNSYSDINAAVQKYVTHRMTKLEAEEFEAYFLSNPEVIEMIEDAQSMRVGLNEFGGTAKNETQESYLSAGLSNLWNIIKIPVPAYAAVVGSAIVASIVSMVVVDSYSQRQPSFVAFGGESVRSAELADEVMRELDIDLSILRPPTIIQFKVHNPEAKYFRAYLYDADKAEVLWSSPLFTIGNQRDHSLRLPDQVRANSKFRLVSMNEDNSESSVEFCNLFSRC